MTDHLGFSGRGEAGWTAASLLERDDVPLPGMIGEHRLMREVYRLARRVAPTDLPVLIVGETGTGKELVARAIHQLSGRAGPFVAFNVSAIAEPMVEDALFGHVRGAFTGALEATPGYLFEAHRGTVFLDEIGALALGVQPKLLRAIEVQQFRPVGGRSDTCSEFRLLAATNAEMSRLVAEGRFRADLAHRLGAVVVRLPPLRARLEDVPSLAREFARQAGVRLNVVAALDDSALPALLAHRWPGNVRELQHVLVRAAFHAHGAAIGPAHALAALEDGALGSSAEEPQSLDALRYHHVRRTVQACEGDTRRAAEMLGISRRHVYRFLGAGDRSGDTVVR